HGRHVEVQRKQAAVGVTEIQRTLRRNLRMRQAWDGSHPVRQRGRRPDLLELLKLEERNRLWYAVFRDRKILRRQALHRLAALILHGPLSHYQPRLGVKDERVWRRSGGLLRGGGEGGAQQQLKESVHGQNLTRRVVCKVRIWPAGFGRPNCALPMTVFQLGNTG